MNIRDPWNTITVFKGKPQLPKQSAFIMVVPSKGCIELNWLISYSDKPPELYEVKNTKIEHEDSYIIVATSSDAPAGMTEEDRQNLENMEFRLDPKEYAAYNSFLGKWRRDEMKGLKMKDFATKYYPHQQGTMYVSRGEMRLREKILQPANGRVLLRPFLTAWRC